MTEEAQRTRSAAIHPAIAAKCTKKQIEVFEQIGAGVTNPPAALKTLEALYRKGLIASQWEIVGRDRFGEIKMPRWFVPIPVHMQWCSWCDENATEEECSYED